MTPEQRRKVWLPKAAFEEDCTLTDWGRRMYQQKLEDTGGQDVGGDR